MSKQDQIAAAFAAHRAATTLTPAEKAEQEDYCWKEGDYALLDHYRALAHGGLTAEEKAEYEAARARVSR